MPVDYSCYPADWKAISLRIRKRDGWRCRWCGKPNGERIAVMEPGYWWDERVQRWRTERGEISRFDTPPDRGSRRIKVVLTVAHYPDHTPSNCADDNLQALCQRCHLRADRFHHAEHAAETRRKRKVEAGQTELPL